MVNGWVVGCCLVTGSLGCGVDCFALWFDCVVLFVVVCMLGWVFVIVTISCWVCRIDCLWCCSAWVC